MWLVVVTVLAMMLGCGDISRAADSVTRIGVSVAGIQIIGLHVEQVFENYAVRAEVGLLSSAMGISLSGIRYLDDTYHRPYVGIGILKYIDSGGFQEEEILCVPAGVDFHLDDREFMQAEFNACVSVQTLTGNPPDRETLYYRLIPKPSMAWKHELK